MSPALFSFLRVIKDGCTCISLSLSVCLLSFRLYWSSVLTPPHPLFYACFLEAQCEPSHSAPFVPVCKAMLTELQPAKCSQVWWRCHHPCVLAPSRKCAPEQFEETWGQGYLHFLSQSCSTQACFVPVQYSAVPHIHTGENPENQAEGMGRAGGERPTWVWTATPQKSDSMLGPLFHLRTFSKFFFCFCVFKK